MKEAMARRGCFAGASRSRKTFGRTQSSDNKREGAWGGIGGIAARKRKLI